MAWTTRRTICRAAGSAGRPIAKLPVDDLVASLARWPRPSVGQAPVRHRPAASAARPPGPPAPDRSPASAAVRARSAGNRSAALVQQGGNVDRHVLAGIEKIGHQHDPPHAPRPASTATWSGMSGRAMEKKAGSTSSAPSRAATARPGRKALVGLGPRAAVADDEDAGGVGRRAHDRSLQRERK